MLNYRDFINNNFFGIELEVIKQNEYIEKLVHLACEIEYHAKNYENFSSKNAYERLNTKPALIVSNIRALIRETIMPELTQLGYSIQEQQKDIEKFYCNKEEGWVMNHLYYGKGYAKVENEEGKKVHKFKTIEEAVEAARKNDINIITATNSGFTLRKGTPDEVYNNTIENYKSGMYSIVYNEWHYNKLQQVEEKKKKYEEGNKRNKLVEEQKQKKLQELQNQHVEEALKKYEEEPVVEEPEEFKPIVKTKSSYEEVEFLPPTPEPKKPTPPPRKKKTPPPTPKARPAHSLSPTPSPTPSVEEETDEEGIDVDEFNWGGKMYYVESSNVGVGGGYSIYDPVTQELITNKTIRNIEKPIQEWIMEDV